LPLRGAIGYAINVFLYENVGEYLGKMTKDKAHVTSLKHFVLYVLIGLFPVFQMAKARNNVSSTNSTNGSKLP